MTATDIFAGRGLACLRGERPVFAGLDFSVEGGGALILRGANGSGKSSLLRVMAGLLRPADGELRWNGRAVAEDADAHRRRVAYLGHLHAAKATLTPAEDVAFWLRYRCSRLSASETAARVSDSLAWAGLAALADLPCRFLSAGQRQRLALARLSSDDNATLWLLDEPTTGLDSDGIEALLARVAQHRGGGGIVVAATHHALNLPHARELDLGGFARRRTDVALGQALLKVSA